MTAVFLDANVLFAAFASPQGGSAAVLELCRRDLLQPFVSRLVLREAERNIRKKLPARALKAFHRSLQTTAFRVVPPPEPAEILTYQSIVPENDAPVLAACVASKAGFLVTLDRKAFMTGRLRSSKVPVRAVTPGDLLAFYLHRKLR